MTDISLAPALIPSNPAPAAPVRAQRRDVFLPAITKRSNGPGRLWHRFDRALGIYATPLIILVVWEVLARTGVLPATYAPAPTDIAATAVELWRDGSLAPDLAISLQRAGIGLSLGLGVGIV